MYLDDSHKSHYLLHPFSHLNADYELWSWDISEIENPLESYEVKNWESKIHPEDKVDAYLKLKSFIEGNALEFDNAYRHLSDSGLFKHIYTKGIAERDVNNVIQRVWGIHIDVTEQLDLTNKLYRLSNFDEHTKLPNASKMWRDFESYVERFVKDKMIYMACIDVDNFNYINNKLGYHIGNNIIKKMVDLLKIVTAPEDYIARVSGDEFILIFAREKRRYEIEKELQSFVDFMRENLYLEESHTQVTISVGCSVYMEHTNNIHELLQKSNTALYYAKKTGKNQFKLYEENLEQFAYHNLDWRQQLRDSIMDEVLEMYYQPIYNCKDSTLVGFESLCRWYHPEKGFISPAVFIRVAEESDLIIDLEKWILKAVFKQLDFWNKKYKKDYFVTINLSGKCMTEYDLPNYLNLLLRYYEVKPQQVEFEITETSIIKNLNSALKTLDDLKAQGFKIALDDFGTGYSSLNYLRSLPIDKVKLDKSFLDDIVVDLKNQMVVKMIIELSRGLCIESVAEGVEKQDQIELLKNFNCDYLQGYYFSKPLPVPKVEGLIECYES